MPACPGPPWVKKKLCELVHLVRLRHFRLLPSFGAERFHILQSDCGFLSVDGVQRSLVTDLGIRDEADLTANIWQHGARAR